MKILVIKDTGYHYNNDTLKERSKIITDNIEKHGIAVLDCYSKIEIIEVDDVYYKKGE